MSVVLKKKERDILANEMEDGQIAEITSWDRTNDYNGKIVQRYSNALIVVGEGFGSSFSTFFSSGAAHKNCRVRLLKEGECIEVTNNKVT